MSTKKIVTIGFLGNVLEWYDFSVYAFMAPVIGQVFFSAADPKVNLLKTFLVFSLSFLIRPLGSVFFGNIGDRKGRAYSLKLSLFLMGMPAVFIGLLPSYDSIGATAIILLVIFRLVQGFAAGGELPGSACYVYEISAEKQRTFFCSFVSASSMLGVLCGSVIATFSLFIFNEQQMNTWGWRVPFLLGAGIIFFLYYIRKQLTDESFIKREERPIIKLITSEYKSVLKVFFLWAFVQTSFYLLFVWMPSYLSIYLNVPFKSAFLLGSIEMGLLIIFTLFFGYIAEKIGRKKMVLFSILTTMLFAYPAFVMLNYQYLPLTFLALLIFALSLGCILGVMVKLMGDLFSSSVRCSGIGLSSTLATAIFGGTAPSICNYLINSTGYLLSPMFFLIAVCCLALPVAFSLKE